MNRGRAWVLTAFAILAMTAAAPGFASKKIIEDGILNIPLRGYPDPTPPPVSPGASERANPGTRAASAEMTAFGSGASDLSRTVGRLGMTIAPSTDIYRERDPRSQLLARLPSGQYFAVKGEQGGYYAVLMIDGSLGWIPTTSVQLLNYDVVAEPQRPNASPFDPSVSRLASAVLREAFNYVGVPYLWGGNGGRGIDCSGLVRNVYARCGIPLPRTAHEQARLGAPVPLSDLRAGDRLYFSVKHRGIDHTGIYIGDGYFIHASMSRGQVGVDRLSKPLYGPNLVDARRFQ